MTVDATEQRSADQEPEAKIDKAVEETFPASDPPAIGGTTRLEETHSESDREARIRRRAYELWEKAGCPNDHTDEYWHRAEAEISAENSGGAGGPGSP
ncbi:DUF2934 domain-containing protein [Paraburkholderia unamae]|uniref:DUF2934 family protein n=1 Tax=Paraburkholderia unamae TaxID=219649 RepID=A0ABX5KN22_9BURK|nr:DUF2934 domain-containing protein [Paraburkholderia unamae]PVX81387.1 hypothetical protein C7402_111289 [Paraburkholderia unamae]RAR54637.1 hypothetical protein C7401_124134 [Paraburkholderia unamae]